VLIRPPRFQGYDDIFCPATGIARGPVSHRAKAAAIRTKSPGRHALLLEIFTVSGLNFPPYFFLEIDWDIACIQQASRRCSTTHRLADLFPIRRIPDSRCAIT
jgi:hypothetical protein